MTGNQVIDSLVAITQTNLAQIEKKMKHLSSEQLSWKPQADTWSLNEIFAHLNEYARFYHSTFQKRMAQTKLRQPCAHFVSSPLGRAAWKSMKLGRANNIKRKFKALSAYNPSLQKALVQGNDWQLFYENQSELLSLLDEARKVNIKRIKTALSISKIIKFRLGDAMMFVVYHNERHVQQALNLLAHPQFPKKK